MLASEIIQSWKANYPQETAALAAKGLLQKAADQAEERSGVVLEQAAAKGLSYSQALELSVQEWGKPPNA